MAERAVAEVRARQEREAAARDAMSFDELAAEEAKRRAAAEAQDADLAEQHSPLPAPGGPGDGEIAEQEECNGADA